MKKNLIEKRNFSCKLKDKNEKKTKKQTEKNLRFFGAYVSQHCMVKEIRSIPDKQSKTLWHHELKKHKIDEYFLKIRKIYRISLLTDFIVVDLAENLENS